MILILLILTVATIFYLYSKWSYSYWKRNNVPGPKPSYIIGNIGPTLTFSENWGVVMENWYKKYANEPYVGMYKLMQPGLLIRDVDLVKDIVTKDFDSFDRNDASISKKWDPLVAANPFFLNGDEWREARKTILPAFTSSKLKNIFPIMSKTGEELITFIKSHRSKTEFDGKQLSLRFTTQNVIKCAYSLDPKCFDADNESEFLKMGKELFAPTFLVGLKFMALVFLPQWIIELIPIPFVPSKIHEFFCHMVRSNEKSRSKNNQSTDILQMLMQVQEKHNVKVEMFLVSHSFALFTDGTETSSIALTFALYELAVNPNCQQKLYEEIVSKLGLNDGKWNAEALQEMIYLEAVLHESMRLHPPATVLTKRCTKPYELPKNKHQSKAITIQPGTVINIPILAIHMDPQYYPDPEKYIPERFLPEQQRNRHKGTYLAFGEGARVCPGMRFAIAQIKVALAYIVKNFRVKSSPNQKPVTIDPASFLNYTKDGILLEFEARS